MKTVKEFLFDDLGIVSVGTLILVLILIIGIMAGELNRAISIEENWNHGHCNNCGREWRYEQAIGHGLSTKYLYICDGCLNTIEIEEYRGE